MRRDELRHAIELPAARAGLQVEPELTDALIADVEGEPGALPLMSTSLLELWQRRDGRRLRMSAYEQVGGVDGAVARLAERTYARLDPAQRDIARRILMRSVGEGEGDAVVRRRVAFDELPGEGVAEVLDILADDRLVTVSEGTVEVAHEALLREWPRLRGWLEEDAQGRRTHQQLAAAAREWDAGGRDPGELYRGARLAGAQEWAGHARGGPQRGGARVPRPESRRERALAPPARAAAHRGRRAVGARRDRRRRCARPTGQRARPGHRCRRTAPGRARPGGERPGYLAAARPPGRRAGRLGADAGQPPRRVGQEPGGDRRDAWRRRASVGLALSPDEHTIVAGDPAGRLYFFDTRTQRRIGIVKPTGGHTWVTQLAFSPDGSRLAVAHDIRADWATSSRCSTPGAAASSAPIKPPPRGIRSTALRYTADDKLEFISVPWDPRQARRVFVRR